MSAIEIWATILGLALATLLTRSTLLVAGARVRLPALLEAALRYAPACALAAIIVPDLLVSDGEVDLSVDNLRLLAGATAAGVYVLTRGTLSTIAGGLAAFWLLRWLWET